jgi:uncharacterized protein YkwD
MTVTGSLDRRQPSRTYRQTVANGTLTATLSYSGDRTMTLRVRDSGGALLAQQAGSSPISITLEVKGSPVSLEVRSPRGTARFKLTIAYPQAGVSSQGLESGPPGYGTVLLSPVLESPAGLPAVGPQLGVPTPNPSAPISAALGFSISDQAGGPFVTAINRFRRTHGLGAVILSRSLSRAALAHVRSLATAGQFTHDWDDGTPFAAWMLRYYPPLAGGSWIAGENLLWGPTEITPSAAVAAWLKSPAHRQILLSASWRELGVGIVAVKEAPGAYGGQDAFIVAADFGTRLQPK